MVYKSFEIQKINYKNTYKHKQIKQIMQEVLKYAEKKGVTFTEIKKLSEETTIIESFDKNIKQLSETANAVYAVKVIYNGFEGLAFSPNPEFKKLIDKAIETSKLLNKKADYKKIEGIKKTFKTNFEINPKDISIEEKKENLLKLNNKAGFKKISSLNLMYADKVKHYEIINSEGAELSWDDVTTAFFVRAYAKQGNQIENFFSSERFHEGYELMNTADSIVKESFKMAEALLKAKYARAGNFPVICDSKLGGTFTHEAVGHACEADIVLQGGSVLGGKLNQKIASDIVNIVDDGTIKNSNGWLPFDDEGIETQRTILVENGVLKNYLHSRATAAIMGAKPTGNGRGQSPTYKTIPRMTTTVILPGKDKFDDMVSSIKDGYYLIDTYGGQVDTTKGEFLFSAKYGYEIKNGQLGSLVKYPSLVGNIIDILPKISMIGNKLELGAGTCGKDGQAVPVGDGSPRFKIDLARVGGKK